MTELDRESFARGVNDAIRALRAVYGGVRTMLEELSHALEEDPAPYLYDLGIRAASGTSKAHPDEKILRSWIGRFYSEAASEEEAEEEGDEEDIDEAPAKSNILILTSGDDLAFAKAVLYDRSSEEGEPHLLVGILRDCRVPAGWESIDIGRGRLRLVLEAVRHDTKPGKLVTKAGTKIPKKESGKGGANKLMFTVEEPPVPYPLYEIRGPEQVQEIAGELKRMWAARTAASTPAPPTRTTTPT